jgi:hypothetical protein
MTLEYALYRHKVANERDTPGCVTTALDGGCGKGAQPIKPSWGSGLEGLRTGNKAMQPGESAMGEFQSGAGSATGFGS